MMRQSLGLLFFLIVTPFLGHAQGNLKSQQTETLSDQQIKKAQTRGINAFGLQRYKEALPLLKAASKYQPNSAMGKYYLGVTYFFQTKSEDQILGIEPLDFAMAHASDGVPFDGYYYLGMLQHLKGNTNLALSSLRKFIANAEIGNMLLDHAYLTLDQCKTALSLSNTQDVAVGNVENVGTTVNTPADEYAPLLTTDRLSLYFTRIKQNRASFGIRAGTPIEDIYHAANTATQTDKTNWSKARIIKVPNQDGLASAVGLTGTEGGLMIFLSDDNGNGDIFNCTVTGDKTDIPLDLDGRINSAYYEGSAFLTSDARTLYFSSDRPWGFGGLDLYKIEKGISGRWRNAVNLGPAVNTAYDEDGPTLTNDGKVLFFHSNSAKSIGGKDIFKSVKVNGQFTLAENVGRPINSSFNDSYFYPAVSDTKAYFVSDRLGGQGGEDIYQVDLSKDIRKIHYATLLVHVNQFSDTARLSNIKVSIRDTNTKENVGTVFRSYQKNTKIICCAIPTDKDLVITIYPEGFNKIKFNLNIKSDNAAKVYAADIYAESFSLDQEAFSKECKIMLYSQGIKTDLNARQANNQTITPIADASETITEALTLTDTATLRSLINSITKNTFWQKLIVNMSDSTIKVGYKKLYADDANFSKDITFKDFNDNHNFNKTLASEGVYDLALQFLPGSLTFSDNAQKQISAAISLLKNNPKTFALLSNNYDNKFVKYMGVDLLSQRETQVLAKLKKGGVPLNQIRFASPNPDDVSIKPGQPSNRVRLLVKVTK